MFMLKSPKFKVLSPFVMQPGRRIRRSWNPIWLKTILGTTFLEFNAESEKSHLIKLGNDMQKNKINDLRAAIYQINGADPELKKIKNEMELELEKAERKLLVDYLKTTSGVQAFK